MKRYMVPEGGLCVQVDVSFERDRGLTGNTTVYNLLTWLVCTKSPPTILLNLGNTFLFVSALGDTKLSPPLLGKCNHRSTKDAEPDDTKETRRYPRRYDGLAESDPERQCCKRADRSENQHETGHEVDILVHRRHPNTLQQC